MGLRALQLERDFAVCQWDRSSQFEGRPASPPPLRPSAYAPGRLSSDRGQGLAHPPGGRSIDTMPRDDREYRRNH
jgi:hypothetical protein